MLQSVARHADARVRRQAVLSLGGVPEAERTPVLLDELARLDPHILSTTLGMLARQRDENVTRFILAIITDSDFEGHSEDVQRALFSALGEVANDSVVSALDKILNHSHGWLGRRTYTQFAAALTLRRLGTPAALQVLERGLKSRNQSVRTACADATKAKAVTAKGTKSVKPAKVDTSPGIGGRLARFIREIVADQRDVISKYALGKFPDLLKGQSDLRPLSGADYFGHAATCCTAGIVPVP
jgi:hypothetical protein